jgi:hypothetical protein
MNSTGKRLFDYDPETGTTKWWHYDADKDEAKIETVFEVGDLIEQNKKQYADTDERARYGEWSKVASIPMALFYRLKAKGIIDDPAAMKRWLNDPDNRFFRTRPGRV